MSDFVQYTATPTAVSGKYGVVCLWVPSGCQRTVYVADANSAGLSPYLISVAPANVAAEPAVNLNGNSHITAEAEVRYDMPVSDNPAATLLPLQSQDVKNLILAPGTGLALTGNPGSDTKAWFRWSEAID